MSVFAISDLHLSTFDKTNKSMEVFGQRWQDYMKRLKTNWTHLVGEDDTVIIPGDISWALSLEEAESDLKFIDSLPGKKILGKGNHDFWWCTMKKHSEFFERHGIKTISFLLNNAFMLDSFIAAGTRGWYSDEDNQLSQNKAEFEKVIRRENGRLETSLAAAKKLKESAPEKEIIVFMHFPPYWNEKESDGIFDILEKYGIKKVYYGHIHGNYTMEPKFSHKGIEFEIISADYLKFIPKIIKLEN